jgi:hypothetical protein
MRKVSCIVKMQELLAEKVLKGGWKGPTKLEKKETAASPTRNTVKEARASCTVDDR